MKTYTKKEALTKAIKEQIESFIIDISPEDQDDVNECLEYIENSIYNVRLNNRVAFRFIKYLNNIGGINNSHISILKQINQDCIHFENEKIKENKIKIANSILTNLQKKYMYAFNDIFLDKLDEKELIDIATILIYQLIKARYENMLVFCSTEDSFDACIRCSIKGIAEAANFGRSWLLFEKKEQIEPFYYKLSDVDQYRGNLKIPQMPFCY